MTIEEIKNSSRTYLTVCDIGKIVGIRPDKLRYQALTDSTKLGFPVCVADKTVRIPRVAFLTWMNGAA